MKKKYTRPEMKSLEIDYNAELLAGSCESNDYWKCPETEDGYENPYWCGH